MSAPHPKSTGFTHEKIETNNFLMIVLILLVVAVGGIVEIVPLFFQRSTTEPVPGLKPYSASGASWLRGGTLALTGHDRTEIYLVTLPAHAPTLRLEGIVPVTTPGQAIDWDPRRSTALWSISRPDRALVLSDLSTRAGKDGDLTRK